MNWSDFLVIGIIAAFAIIGLMNGFIFSIFRLASFLIAAIVSVKFYPAVAQILMKTKLYFSMKASIYNSLLMQHQTQVSQADGQVKAAAADAVINNLQLPGFLKGNLISQMPDPSKLINITQIMDTISGELAALVIDIISLILLYILIRIGLSFLKAILQGIAKLPIFKQMDKLGGFAFGALEGLLTIYILFAVIMLFNAVPQFESFFKAVDSSIFARFFYENNFIVNWMFPKGTGL